MTASAALALPLRIAVVGGGQSCEHDVSRASAADVADALRAQGHEVVALTIARDGVWHVSCRWTTTAGSESPLRTTPLGVTPAASLSAALDFIGRCDVVFPALHGPGGEDGTLAALAALLGIPCVGAPLAAGAIAMDKWATKLVAAAHGIATAPAVLLLPDDDVPEVVLPAVVKPVAAGSSYGVSLVSNRAALAEAVDAARSVDSRILVEQFVEGREVDIAVLQEPDGDLRLGPPLEIGREPGRLFDTAQKYDGSADFRVPAELSPVRRRLLEEAARTVFRALGCRGIARVDFFVTDTGVVLNEVNTMPGLTEFSQVPRIFAADGLEYSAMIDGMVREAMERSMARVPV